MIKEQTWEEFRKAGMLWWINMLLNTFGWAIVYDYNNNNEIVKVYPARVKYRGYSPEINTEGYVKVSQYLHDNYKEILEEAKS